MSFEVNVDPSNPGQFFACCGLLELADRLWPEAGAEGWFDADTFRVECAGALPELLRCFADVSLNSSLSEDELRRLGSLLSKKKAKLTPAEGIEKERLRGLWQQERLRVAAPLDFWVDWWWDDRSGGARFKTWAAKQLVVSIARGLQASFRGVGWADDQAAGCLSRTASTGALPFNFDSGLSGAGSALDAGFSSDVHSIRTAFKPVTELAAFVGLQRFRPARTGASFRYSTWSVRVPPSVAAAYASGAMDAASCPRYEFQVFSRTQYMKVFLPATSIGDAR